MIKSVTKEKFLNYLQQADIQFLEKGTQFYQKNNKESIEIKVENYRIYILEMFMQSILDPLYPDETVSRMIFTGFDQLSIHLKKSGLSIKEAKEIIFDIITKNLFAILEMNTSNVEMLDTEKTIYNCAALAVQEDSVKNLQDLFSFQKSKNDTFHNMESTYLFNDQTIEKCHLLIGDHLLLNEYSYTQEEIDIIIKALNELKISKELTAGIRRILEKKLLKRQKEQEPVQPLFQFQTTPKNSENRLLTDKEYKAIKKELNTYYDFYHNQVIRPLSYEEVIYCVSQMIRIGEDRNRIIEFLMKTLDSSNPITLEKEPCFQERLNYFRFYQDKYSLQEEIATLEQYYEEMQLAFTTGNQDDYLFWKNTLLEEDFKLQQTISKDYEYEIHLAKKRLKTIPKKEEKGEDNE